MDRPVILLIIVIIALIATAVALIIKRDKGIDIDWFISEEKQQAIKRKFTQMRDSRGRFMSPDHWHHD